MVELIRTSSKSKDFIGLVKHLDDYLKTVDGDDHAFYNQYNNIDVLKHVVVVYYEGKPIGCGAFKEFNTASVEIKRMFTLPEYRGKGIAYKILSELEVWTKELSYKSCFLETGKRQIEAVQFYKKNSYIVTPNYGQYKNVDNSLCFKKMLS